METQIVIATATGTRKPWHTSALARFDRVARHAIALAPDSAPPGMTSA